MADKKLDDLEAVRQLVAALEGFGPDDQERIIRWTREKLGLSFASEAVPSVAPPAAPPVEPEIPRATQAPIASPTSSQDIKAFVNSKNPSSDSQFAATVAYYYQFEAPADKRKDFITKADLQDACRQVGRRRIRYPAQTLVNAHNGGLLDKAEERGGYTINAVGENLVAMTLPGAASSSQSSNRKRTPKKKSGAKKARSKKKTASKKRASKKTASKKR